MSAISRLLQNDVVSFKLVLEFIALSNGKNRGLHQVHISAFGTFTKMTFKKSLSSPKLLHAEYAMSFTAQMKPDRIFNPMLLEKMQRHFLKCREFMAAFGTFRR